MQVKTDTKEKFHVITVLEPTLSAGMTDDLADLLLPYLSQPAPAVRNLILVLRETATVEKPVAEKLVRIQQQFYENGSSFVICELQPAVEKFLDEAEMLELMNATPTESEAWDIVQMEEIEREFLNEE